MKIRSFFLILTITILPTIGLMSSLTSPSFAQEEAKCNGPVELCAQVLELKSVIASQKQTVLSASKEEESSETSGKLLAAAALAAVILKLLISTLKSWTSWIQTDKQKAVMKAGLLILGFALFVVGNVAIGLPWWQALIVAGGPPGAILVHELTDLFRVFKGEKPLPPELDPTKDSQPPVSPPVA